MFNEELGKVPVNKSNIGALGNYKSFNGEAFKGLRQGLIQVKIHND